MAGRNSCSAEDTPTDGARRTKKGFREGAPRVDNVHYPYSHRIAPVIHGLSTALSRLVPSLAKGRASKAAATHRVTSYVYTSAQELKPILLRS